MRDARSEAGSVRSFPTAALGAGADAGALPAEPAVAAPATFVPRAAERLAPSPALPHVRVASQTLAELTPEWDELARRVQAPPHARPGWVLAWWRSFGAGRLEIRTLRRDGRLVALVPVVPRWGALAGAANWHSPELPALAEDWAAATAMACRLFEARPRRLSLLPLDPAGRTAQAVVRVAEETGYRVLLRAHASGPALAIEGDWASYEARLSHNLASHLRRSRRRLERVGPLSIEVAEGRSGLARRLEEAFAVEASGWKGAGGTAIASRGDTGRFYGELARWAAPEGLLRLFFLRVGERAVAMFFALVQDGVCHLLKGGYDPAFGRCSPGQVLMREVLAWAHQHDVARVEFHGGAEPYKLRWGGTVRERARFEAFAPGPVGRFGWILAAHARPALRRLLGRRAASDGSA